MGSTERRHEASETYSGSNQGGRIHFKSVESSTIKTNTSFFSVALHLVPIGLLQMHLSPRSGELPFWIFSSFVIAPLPRNSSTGILGTVHFQEKVRKGEERKREERKGTRPLRYFCASRNDNRGDPHDAGVAVTQLEFPESVFLRLKIPQS